MPSVIACYKWVFDEADVVVEDDLRVSYARAKKKISEYDKNAIEAAAQAAASLGGRAIGLTLGDASAAKSAKEALSRSLDEVIRMEVVSEAALDAAATAKILAQGIQSVEDAVLVVCADGSSDAFNRQTAPRIAARLDWPCVTAVASLEATENGVVAVRALDEEIERVEVDYPCVVSVLPEAATPPIPGLKAIMAAGKKPQSVIEEREFSDNLTPKVEKRDERGFSMERKQVVLEGDDAATELAAALRKEGVL